MASSSGLPAEPDQQRGQDSDAIYRELVADLGNMIQNFEDLERSYRERASELSTEHIGVYIQKIADTTRSHRHGIAPPFFGQHPKIRQLVRSIVNFVLDQYQDPTRLNEQDRVKRTPLDIAIELRMMDCFEILLARGADPDLGLNIDKSLLSYEFLGIIYLHDLVNLWKETSESDTFDEYFSYARGGRDKWMSRMRPPTHIGLDSMLTGMPWEVRPDSAGIDNKPTWIHVPITNVSQDDGVVILVDVRFRSLCSTNMQSFLGLGTTILEDFESSIRAPAVTPGDPLLNYRDSTFSSFDWKGKNAGSFMVFPCLTLDTICNVRRVRNRYKTCRKEPLGMYGNGDEKFLGICLDRTLDEAYFPSRNHRFFGTRNRDQVVSKEWLRTNEQEKEKDRLENDSAPMLLVPQIWLWTFGHVLLSAYSSTHTSTKIPIFLDETMFGHKAPNFYLHDDMETPVDLQMGVIMASCISEFGEEHDSADVGSRFKSTLHMFETAVTSTLSEVEQYLNTGPASYAIKEQKKKEQKFIHAISDIHSELDMISAVLEQQKKVMERFLEHTQKQRDSAEGGEMAGWTVVMQGPKLINEYETRILKIHRDADRVEKTIDSYLNLKRTYASIEDTRNSLMVGFAATAFAFVTVIFTPLSFMTSLFALPVDQFVRQQSQLPDQDARVYSSAYVGGYTALAAIVTWLLTAGLLLYLWYLWRTRSNPEKGEKETSAIPSVDADSSENKEDEEIATRSLSASARKRRSGLRNRMFRIHKPKTEKPSNV